MSLLLLGAKQKGAFLSKPTNWGLATPLSPSPLWNWCASIRSGPGKPNQRKASSWFFLGGIPEQTFNMNRACFPKEKHQNLQKWAKFMNFSFWPFLWFGLPGRLLNQTFLITDLFYTDFGKEFPSRTLWRGPSWNCPCPSSVLCPKLKRAKREKRTCEDRSD